MAEENTGMEPAPGSPPPGAARLNSGNGVLRDKAFEDLWDAVVLLCRAIGPTGNDDEIIEKLKSARENHVIGRRWRRENKAERSGAPEASSPKGPTNVTQELPRAPRAHGEKEGGQR